MRRAAAERGRRGDREAKRRGGLVGGLLSWHTRTPEQQEAIRARLRAQGGHQANATPKARAAQAARAKAALGRLTAAKAAFLADVGILRRGSE